MKEILNDASNICQKQKDNKTFSERNFFKQIQNINSNNEQTTLNNGNEALSTNVPYKPCLYKSNSLNSSQSSSLNFNNSTNNSYGNNFNTVNCLNNNTFSNINNTTNNNNINNNNNNNSNSNGNGFSNKCKQNF